MNDDSEENPSKQAFSNERMFFTRRAKRSNPD